MDINSDRQIRESRYCQMCQTNRKNCCRGCRWHEIEFAAHKAEESKPEETLTLERQRRQRAEDCLLYLKQEVQRLYCLHPQEESKCCLEAF